MTLRLRLAKVLSLENVTYDAMLLNCGLFIAMGVVILIVNAIALLIFKNRTLRSKKSSLLLVSMTVADALVGLNLMLLWISIIRVFHGDSLLDFFLLGFAFLFQLSVSASIISLSTISIERFIAVFWPFSHRLARKQHYYLAIGSVWLLACVIPVSFHLYIRDILSLFMCYAFIFTILIVSCSAILISYLSIWIKMKFFTKIQPSRTMQENKNLTKTLFIVTVLSLVTWSPLHFKKLVVNANIDKDYDLISKLLLLSNSLINVIIYSFRIPEFQRELKNMCFIRCLTRRYRIEVQRSRERRNCNPGIQLESFQTQKN